MAKLFQTRLKIEEQTIDIIPFDPKIEQGATTPILSNPKINQGSTTLIQSNPTINQGQSSVLKNIEFNPNQGQVEISPIRPIQYDTANQISLDLEKAKIDYFVLRQSNLLKQNIPTILPLLSPGLSTVPLTTNRLFANNISLEDRLNQSRIAGSTTGLPQFFLADFYTGVLPDIRYNFTPNQGSIIIQSLLFTPNQGSITITNIQFTPNQGEILITPFNYNPNQGDIIISLFNFIPNQGTVTINGVTTSFIGSLSFSFLPNQGSVIITPYGFVPNQDAQTVVTSPISINQILLGQGTIIDQTGNLVSFIIPQLIIAAIEQGSTTITVPNFTPDQGTAIISEIEFNPNQGSSTPDITSSVNSILKAFLKPKEVHGEANLNILGYELDRLLARGLPEVKHGSTLNLSNQPVSSGEPSPNFGPRYLVNGIYLPIPANVPIQALKGKTILDNNPGVKDKSGRGEPSPNFGPRLPVTVDDRDIYLPIPIPDEKNPYTPEQQGILEFITNKKRTPNTPGPSQNPLDPDKSKKIPDPETDGSSYPNNYIAEAEGGVAYRGIDNKWLTEKKQQQQQESNQRQAGQLRSNADNDLDSGLINFSITSVRDGSTLVFKPYLTAFSDNWSPQYTDVKYVGRQDIQKVFTSVTRTVSIGFKIGATSESNLIKMYKKINTLIQITSLGQYFGRPYMIGPMLRVTVGDYLINTPCIATSLKVDSNPGEYPWSISEGTQGTQFLDVSLDLTMLADNNGNIFTSTGTYINIA